ncbi:MAG: protein kinase [bacterium]
MTLARRAAIEALFHDAVDLESGERRRLLDARCGDDLELRREIEALLTHAGATGSASSDAASFDEHSQPAWMAPGASLGKYELIRRLGAGGMSTVFLARDVQLARRVAIKFLDRAIDRFLDEARATARCEHENIVRIYEAGTHDGRPFLVLEHLEGRTLRAVLDEQTDRGIPIERAAELMAPVLRALTAAHAQGVVHCDLKPENVVLTDGGVTKVLDFGIARLVEQGMAGAIVPIGTLPYMSPEQLVGEGIDHRSDLWAVGVMLFELVVGRRPHASAAEQIHDLFTLETPVAGLVEERAALGRLGPLVERCLAKRLADRIGSAAELAAALDALAREAPAQAVDDRDPFAGLAPFQPSDADRFFGRDREIAAVVDRVRRTPLVAIAGPSGAGKSSLARAGVVPALERASAGWQAFVVRPGLRPLEVLAGLLDRLSTPDEHPVDLAARPGEWGRRLRVHAARTERRVLVVIDQFEELYTLGADAPTRARFFACLDGAADDATSPLRLLITVRADFLHRATEDGAFMAELVRGLYFLPPPTRDGLRDALVRPLAAAGYRFEAPAQVEVLLDELAETSGALPLLQFAAARLWALRDRERRLITRANSAALGGIAGALAEQADAVIAGLSPAEVTIARAICVRLVTARRTRASVLLAELPPDPARAEPVIRRLVDGRLLTIAAPIGGEGGGETVELVHESLIERWPRLVSWLAAGEQDAALVDRLRSAAAQWASAAHPDGLLWHGREAREAVRWARRRKSGERDAPVAPLGATADAFLRAVVRHATRGQRLRRALVAASVIAATTLAVVFSHLAAQARDEARRARNSARMIAAREQADDPTTALAILREIEPPLAHEDWARMTREALGAGPAAAVLTHPAAIVAGVAFSPDNRRLVTAAGDEKLRVWDPERSDPLLVIPSHRANAVAFDPTGGRIVTAGKDHTARVYAIDSSTPPVVLRGHTDNVYDATFSPDGRRIATASWDRTVRISPADGIGAPVVLRGHEGWVYEARFSADGARVVTGAFDATVRLWRADGTGEAQVLRGHDHVVVSVDLDPGGRRIASASIDGTVRIWPLDGGEPRVLRHPKSVFVVRFSPDGASIATGGEDGIVRLFRADDGSAVRVLAGHRDAIHDLAFSPDGRLLASAAVDHAARLWRLDHAPGHVTHPVHSRVVDGIAPATDGRRLLVSGHGSLALATLRADGGVSTRTLSLVDEPIAAAFAPDGQRIVIGSTQGTAVVVALDAPGAPQMLRGHDDWVEWVDFSPTGDRVLTASLDGTARIWPLDGGPSVVLAGHTDRVLCARFSPDGRQVATASADLTVRLWSVEGAPLRVWQGHEGKVFSVAFDPRGAAVASASNDATVRIWPIDAGGEARVLRGHRASVYQVAYRPDGHQLASVSHDGTARVWATAGDAAPIVVGDREVPLHAVAWLPDGRLALGAGDGRLHLLAPPAPITPTDRLLWQATRYCLSVAFRRGTLGIDATAAAREHDRCRARVDGH